MTSILIFLEFKISGNGISPEESKIQAIQEWPKPSSITEVRSFLGLAVFYRRFIKGFSSIAAPITEILKEEPDFGQVLEEVKRNLRDDYSLHNGYLFKGVALCIPATSLRYLIIKEIYNQCHFGLEKTLHLVRERFFWPSMWRDIKHFIRACHVCQTSKGTNTNQGLYNPLPIPFECWCDISMDFVTRLPMTRKKMIASWSLWIVSAK
jgi:Integrase zinc binding domain